MRILIVIIFSVFTILSYYVFSNSIDLPKKMEKQLNPSKCIEGVSYLIFPQGITVQYTKDGKIKTCE